jgi:hypothetical protein
MNEVKLLVGGRELGIIRFEPRPDGDGIIHDSLELVIPLLGGVAEEVLQ